MSVTQAEYVLEVLNNIFAKCDVDGAGAVEMNTLIYFLTSQDPSWQQDKRVEEEFRKLLYCDESTHLITKDHFINSLSEWYGSNCDGQEANNNEEMSSGEIGEKCSSSSSGIGESSEINSASSSDSIEKNFFPSVYFVSDGQTLTNEDGTDEVSNTDSESPRVNLKLIKALENEVNSLQRKNEYLESTNSTLLGQMSALEETMTRSEKESSLHLKRLSTCAQLLEAQRLKQEEVEEKLNMVTENNKSVTIELSQCERENSRLKELIIQHEKQIDRALNENMLQDSKIQDMKDRLNTLSHLHSSSLGEMEDLKMKETADKEALSKLLDQNLHLESQLYSSDVLIQDLKSELAATQRQLTALQNENIINRLQPKSSTDDLSADNSMILFDGNVTLDCNIPFETSLLAELQEKMFERSQVELRDAGVNCSIKSSIGDEEVDEKNCRLCHLKSKRSFTKWMFLVSIFLLLCFLLGFISSFVILANNFKHRKPPFCLMDILDFFHVSVTYPDLRKPIT